MPTVQVPPRGIWGRTGPAAFTTTEAWLGGQAAPGLAPDELVLRYLAAFGPATVRDVQAWCGLTRLGEVAERLRPRLRVFRAEGGGELFDLPDAPRPDAGTPAPPRFLPEYDNVLLSHADRARVIPGRRSVPLPPGHGGSRGTVLVDGFWAATWKASQRDDRAVLRVEAFTPLRRGQADAVTAEGMRLLAFLAPDAGGHDVQIGGPNLSESAFKFPLGGPYW